MRLGQIASARIPDFVGFDGILVHILGLIVMVVPLGEI
jgi:hypothetical protein